MSVDDAIRDAVRVAVREELRRHVPRTALGVVDAAMSLGVGEDRIRQLVDEGRLPRVPHVGKRTLIAVKALEEFANTEAGPRLRPVDGAA